MKRQTGSIEHDHFFSFTSPEPVPEWINHFPYVFYYKPIKADTIIWYNRIYI